jgi:D-glycero-D-manno-heptose 1,7-bisphosphate phosphatase
VLQALFLDRDGVINVDRPEGVLRWEDFELLPGALEALAALARAGIPVFVITNQAAVGRGAVARSAVTAIHDRMRDAIRDAGGALAGIYACFHAAEERCGCRKPAPGLLVQAAAEHRLDLGRVAFAGDDRRDLEAARAAGAIPLLVLTGKGRATAAAADAGAREVFADLGAVARAVIEGRIG